MLDEYIISFIACSRSRPAATERIASSTAAKRLQSDGFDSVVVHGGMDKQEALDRFERPAGPNILLSSEVAAEGVDLQFSSLVVNYDLPWNPAKIEQRIGRIDRIGQEESQILIWNLVYEDTVDDRVYERLLEQLTTFRQALGSMEAVLGDEISRFLRLKATSEQSRGYEAACGMSSWLAESRWRNRAAAQWHQLRSGERSSAWRGLSGSRLTA